MNFDDRTLVLKIIRTLVFAVALLGSPVTLAAKDVAKNENHPSVVKKAAKSALMIRKSSFRFIKVLACAKLEHPASAAQYQKLKCDKLME